MNPNDNEELNAIGAGVIGAALAQGLRKANIKFTIVDRDEHLHARGQGWGIGIHWALPALERLLPAHLMPLVYATQIDARSPGPQPSTMLGLDATTGAPVFRIPPGAPRLRVRALNQRGYLSWKRRVRGPGVGERINPSRRAEAQVSRQPFLQPGALTRCRTFRTMTTFAFTTTTRCRGGRGLR